MTNVIFSSAIVPFPPHTPHAPPPTRQKFQLELRHKTPAKHVPNSETMQYVITSYSAIHWLAELMCGPSAAGCGGEIWRSDIAQG